MERFVSIWETTSVENWNCFTVLSRYLSSTLSITYNFRIYMHRQITYFTIWKNWKGKFLTIVTFWTIINSTKKCNFSTECSSKTISVYLCCCCCSNDAWNLSSQKGVADDLRLFKPHTNNNLGPFIYGGPLYLALVICCWFVNDPYGFNERMFSHCSV